MQAKNWVLTLGIGAAAGAVAILMLPRQNAARRLASQAAIRMEDAMYQMSDKLMD